MLPAESPPRPRLAVPRTPIEVTGGDPVILECTLANRQNAVRVSSTGRGLKLALGAVQRKAHRQPKRLTA